MPQIQSSYDNPNKVRTSVSGAPAEGYELLRALTYDRKGDYEERRSKRSQERPYSSEPRKTRPRAVVTEGPGARGGLTPMERHLRDAQARAEILRLQAEGAPPPMRMTTFASGANNFYTPDVNAMNAYQRAAYLPKEAAEQQQDPRLQPIADRIRSENADAEWKAQQDRQNSYYGR